MALETWFSLGAEVPSLLEVSAFAGRMPGTYDWSFWRREFSNSATFSFNFSSTTSELTAEEAELLSVSD